MLNIRYYHNKRPTIVANPHLASIPLFYNFCGFYDNYIIISEKELTRHVNPHLAPFPIC